MEICTRSSKTDGIANLRVEIELRSLGQRGLQKNVVQRRKSLQHHTLHLSKGVYRPYQQWRNIFVRFAYAGKYDGIIERE